jgi:ankyrin repeat protein
VPTFETLLDAVNRGDTATVKVLVEADPAIASARTSSQPSAILAALYRGLDEIVAALVAHIPLDVFEAAALGRTDRVRELVDYDPSLVGQYSHDGWTPLHLAAFFGRCQVAEYLLDKGAKPSLLSKNAMANQPLHAAIAGKTDRRLVELLVERGAGVNERAAMGVTPLHLAASRGDAGLVEFLFQRGADPTAQMDDGTTPDAIAAKRGHEGVAAQLKANQHR